MKYRKLGKTDTPVSEVGLGTWQLGSADWGVVDEREAIAILHKSVEQGVNFIDTADVYGGGISERIIGKFLKETRETVYVATKLGRKVSVRNDWMANFTLDVARKHTQESLRNLGVDAIFLQQWHCIPTDAFKSGEYFTILETLKREGLIRHWGCSVESVEEGLICAEHPGCASLQVIYNIFRQKLTDELLPRAARNRVGILARVPLASGLLAGKFKAGHQFEECDHRNYNADGQAFNAGETFAGVPFARGVEFAEQIRAILKPGREVSLAQLALRWILDHPEVTTIIPGATRLTQAESNAAVSGVPPLGREQHAALETLYREKIAPTIRGKY